MSQLSPLFAALGDPTRFAIVDRLLRDGELSAGAITQIAPLSKPAFSRHLRVLREAGLIDQRISKQHRIYSVRPEAVREISAWVMDHKSFWENSLDRLGAAIEQDHAQGKGKPS